MAPGSRRSLPRTVLVALVGLVVVLGVVGLVMALRTPSGNAPTAGTSATVPGPGPSTPVASASSPSAYAPPDAASTGVPDGTALTDYTGPSTIVAAGTVIEAKKITTCLVIKADDVTIKNSLIQSACLFNVLADNGDTGLMISDVEVDGQDNTSGDSAVNGSGYTCLRCDIHGTSDGFKAGNDVTIKDSWIHDLAMTADSHNDGIQSLGTARLTIEGNTIVLADGATSAVILSTGSANQMRGVTITGNLLGGGAFTVFGGYQAGTDDKSKVADIAITDNRFSTRIHPRSGTYGAITSADSPVTVSGNTWYDGPKAGQPLA